MESIRDTIGEKKMEKLVSWLGRYASFREEKDKYFSLYGECYHQWFISKNVAPILPEKGAFIKKLLTIDPVEYTDDQRGVNEIKELASEHHLDEVWRGDTLDCSNWTSADYWLVLVGKNEGISYKIKIKAVSFDELTEVFIALWGEGDDPVDIFGPELDKEILDIDEDDKNERVV